MPGNEQKDERENKKKRNGEKKFPDEVSILARFGSSKMTVPEKVQQKENST